MPTPHGSRGGMAFGVEELRVLRRALALALHPAPASAEDVQDCLRLAESLDEAMREGARLRAFLVADLARYRAALPGTAAGYVTLLDEALGAGYHPTADDLSALRALRGNPTAATLLRHCRTLAEQDVRARLTRSTGSTATVQNAGREAPQALQVPHARPAAPAAPAPPTVRTRLLALPGGLADAHGQDSGKKPEKKPAEKPAPKPAPTPPPGPGPGPGPGPAPTPAAPKPGRRPIPTPGEVFPRRKPTPPPAGPNPGPKHHLAAG